jgi:uncharacterized SAM-binding protein YcdF (DUF218 family)
MSSVANVVKGLLVPGSIAFLVLSLVTGVALLYGNQPMQRWGRRWLTAVLVLYGCLSTPLGADILATPLTRQFSAIERREAAQGAQTVVVLSVSSEVYRANGQEVAELGKATAHNALEGARVYRLLGVPTVIASGGFVSPDEQGPSPSEILRDALLKLGIPAERIVVESRSRTTREQAVLVGELLRARGVRRFVLVTEANHMPRAVATFRGLGLLPVPSAPPLLAAGDTGLLGRLRPDINALRQSDWAAYEHLARLYYWARGWGAGS